VVELLSHVSTAPIYAAADITIGSGAVGGYVVDFDRSGELIAAIVVQTLHGDARPSISISPDATASYIFDGRQLERWGFAEKLVAAVRWYLDGLQKRTNLKITFEAPAEITQLGPEAERALFRIVQESMNNVLRHSTGQRIVVALFHHGATVRLEIEDDGIGMSAQQLAQAEGAALIGVGIAGMRERLRQLAGTLKIHSGASGTIVTATVPIDEERYAAAHSVGRWS
jgi:hypothetical protein